MRVLAAFAAPTSLQDLLLNKTLLSLFCIHPPTPRVQHVTGDALDPRYSSYERTASDAPSAADIQCVCWLFILKDTEPSPLRDSFSVRQQGGYPDPPLSRFLFMS
jgi:hypothetical protein